jgi:hypothetical protein
MVSPASAALPQTPPSQTVRCANGKTARVWEDRVWDAYQADGSPDYESGSTITRLAGQNLCKSEWVEMSWSNGSESNASASFLWLAPGAKFNWDQAQFQRWGYPGDDFGPFVGLTEAKYVCRNQSGDPYRTDNSDGELGFASYGWTGRVYGYSDVRSVPECGSKQKDQQHSQTKDLRCSPDQEHWWPYARLTWKMDGKKIIKIAVQNYCSESQGPAIVWWRYKGGTAAVWVYPGDYPNGYADLWKSELKELPTKTTDGQVHFTNDRAVQDDDIYTYVWTASGDSLVCWVPDECDWRKG